ncbi:MAG TPA: tetratricopeptide repeat protein [Candidatus Acidoferrales bacterium]|jgi:tetratricopeptide (TPR) repeat protein|nr:tetratricopeptide repeat protein [Candidatus Acidoferrales bacterium]
MKPRFARIPGFALALLAGATILSTIVPVGATLLCPTGFAADASGAIQTAQHQFNSGNYTAAIKTLQTVPQASTNAEAQYWIGRCYYELHDYDNAITAAEKSVELDPKSSLYHEWLGRIYGGKADRDRSFSYARKVKKEFEEAVRLNPSNIDARRDLEQYSMEAPWVVGGSKDEAKEQVTAIESIDPVEGHLARAAYDLDAKKPELAEKEYREVLAAKPKRIEPYFDVINFFIHQNKPVEVEAAIQAALQVSPSDPRLTYYRGVSRVLSGTDLPRGEEYLKSYLASSPDRSDWPSHAGAREWLGRLYEAEGKRAEAAEQYRAALQLDPGRKEAKSRLEKLEKSSR